MLRPLYITLTALAGCALAFLYFFLKDKGEPESYFYHNKEFKHAFVVERAGDLLGFTLLDPEDCPSDVKESVIRGYKLFLDTPSYAKGFSKNALSCTHCHFMGGDTLGGKNGGISLVGVTNTYPQFSKRSGKVITLEERITNCFERSMNGIAPSIDSPIIKDTVAYLKWISKEVETLKSVPWLGLPSIHSEHIPNAQKGKEIYITRCAACHGIEGEGSGVIEEGSNNIIPPLWGNNSFNSGAGMNTIGMLAPFVMLNMPFQGADLSDEEALDVSAYLIDQKRPKFNPKKAVK